MVLKRMVRRHARNIKGYRASSSEDNKKVLTLEDIKGKNHKAKRGGGTSKEGANLRGLTWLGNDGSAKKVQ